MARVVTQFQQRVFPGQKTKHHGAVDHDTLDKLELELNQKDRSSSLMKSNQDTDIADLLVFITGYKDEDHKGGTAQPPSVLGEEARTFAKVTRPGRASRFIGFWGTLDRNANVEAALGAIERSYDPTCKLILYGYSAGAVQVMKICERIELKNESRKREGKPLIVVDLLATNDAALGEQTSSLTREVAGCVRKNANFFQTIQSPNHGGRNTAKLSNVNGNVCTIEDVDMTKDAAIQAPLRRGTPHGVMEQLGFDEAMKRIRSEMAAAKAFSLAAPARTAMLQAVRV